MNEAIGMQVSAFVDGELPDNEAQLLLRRLSQDPALRQQAAEYIAMGRAMRGHGSIAEVANLRGRIAAALEDTAVEAEFQAIEPPANRYMRPLAGFAIAASVALVAIFGLQQVTLSGLDSAPPEANSASIDASYTVPDMEYFQRHNQYSSESGSNNLDARLVTVRTLEDGTLETDLEEIEPPVEDEAPAADPERPAP